MVAVFTQVSFSATLDSKGRITVPSDIRDTLGLEKGDKVSVGFESCRVVRKSFSSERGALDFLSGLANVESFSFDGRVLEVVLRE